MTGMSGGDPAVGSNSIAALAWLRAKWMISATGMVETSIVHSGVIRLEQECTAEDSSSGMVWQSCGAVLVGFSAVSCNVALRSSGLYSPAT